VQQALERSRGDAGERFRIALRCLRVGQLRVLLSTPENLDADTFDREVWPMEARTLLRGQDITGQIYPRGDRRHLELKVLTSRRCSLRSSLLRPLGSREEDTTIEPSKTLALIQRYASLNQYDYSRHARQRMRQRNIAAADVHRALCGAHQVIVGNDEGTWKVTGKDCDRDDLDIVVTIEDGLLIITLM